MTQLYKWSRFCKRVFASRPHCRVPIKMASYAHSMISGSLPSDYAVVSQYAAARSNGMEQEFADPGPSSTNDGEGRARRPSHPSMPAPSIPTHNLLLPNPTENTPLLNPPVPRILERDEETQNDSELSTAAVYLSELRILTKYS